MTKEEFKKVRDLVDGSEDLAAEADGTEYMCPSELRALQEEVQSLWWDLADSVCPDGHDFEKCGGQYVVKCENCDFIVLKKEVENGRRKQIDRSQDPGV
jgi:hypothetical protein